MSTKDTHISAADYRKGNFRPAVTGIIPEQGEPDAGRESAIQAEIVRELRALGYVAFHIPNGGKRRRVEAAILKGMGTMAGVADLCVMLPGNRSLWVEVKSDSGTERPGQKDFAATCKRLGHPYFVTRSCAAAVAWVEETERATRVATCQTCGEIESRCKGGPVPANQKWDREARPSHEFRAK